MPRLRRYWSIICMLLCMTGATLLFAGCGGGGSTPLLPVFPFFTPQAPTPTTPPPPTTPAPAITGITRVSLDPANNQFANDAIGTSVTADGTTVVFVADDVSATPSPEFSSKGSADQRRVYVRNVTAGTTTELPPPASGNWGLDGLQRLLSARITPDGHWVVVSLNPVFIVNALGQVTMDNSLQAPTVDGVQNFDLSFLFQNDNPPAVWLYDLSASPVAAPTLVSLDDFNNPFFVAYDASISNDGRFVCFQAFTPPQFGVRSDNPLWYVTPQVYVRDLATNKTNVISKDQNGNLLPTFALAMPEIAGGGQFIAFNALVQDLNGNPVGLPQVFVRDQFSKTTTLVSTASGQPLSLFCWMPSISADGRFVAFSAIAPPSGSTASRTIPFLNQPWNVFQNDNLGTTVEAPVHAGFNAALPEESQDGRFVSYTLFQQFQQNAGAALPVTPTPAQIFVWSVAQATDQIVSVDANGNPGNADSPLSGISEDGRYVVMTSKAQLTPDDTLIFSDVYETLNPLWSLSL